MEKEMRQLYQPITQVVIIIKNFLLIMVMLMLATMAIIMPTTQVVTIIKNFLLIMVMLILATMAITTPITQVVITVIFLLTMVM